MTGVRANLDFRLFFEATPSPVLLLLPNDPVFTILAANDAYLRISGRQRSGLVDRGIFEVFSDNAGNSKPAGVQELQASLRRVIETRRPDRLPPRWHDLERYRNALNTPIPVADGSIGFICHSVEEVTETILLDQRTGFPVHHGDAALLANQTRQALMLELLQREQKTSDPDVMMLAAAEAVGRYLESDRAGFYEVADETVHFTVGWTAGSLPLLNGEFPAEEIDGRYLAEVHSGRALGISDVSADPLTAESTFPGTGTVALIAAPIIRAGRWRAGFYVNQAQARCWTDEQTTLVRNIGEQTWNAVERARAEEALRRSEARFRFLAESVPQIIWTAVPSGSIDYVNSRGAAYFGVEQETLRGSGWLAWIHPEEKESVAEEWKRCLATGEPYELSFRLRRGVDSSWRWHLTRALPLHDRKGNLTHWLGTTTDIADQKAAETELARLASIVESSEDAIIGNDLNGIVTSWNKGAETLFGYTAAEAIGKDITVLSLPEQSGEMRTALERIRDGESVHHYETVRRRRDGRDIPVSLSVSPILDANKQVAGASEIARDITGKKIAEERYQLLMQRLESLREEERAHLAREIHDVLGQTLTIIKMDIAVAERRLITDPAKAAEKLHRAASHVDKTIRSLRRVASELRPPLLDTLGLAGALRGYTNEIQERTGIGVSFLESSDIPSLTPEQSIAAFRIVQESLTNIIRHSQATQAAVTVESHPNRLRLVVEDNGRGFSASAAAKRSLGLLGMQERARLVKGELCVESRPGAGTQVILQIPLED